VPRSDTAKQEIASPAARNDINKIMNYTSTMQTKTNGRSLPKGWEWVTLGDVCAPKIANRDPRREPDSRFIYVDITSIDTSTKTITEPKNLFGKDAPSRARQIIQTDDVVVSTTRPNLNAVAKITKEFDKQICSTGFCVLRPNQDRLDSDFLFHFVRTKEFIQSLSDLVKGALYPAVTDKDVRAQLIPLPPLDEQRRIANRLNEQLAAVEAARKAAEEQLQAAKQLPSAYLREVFESEEAQQWHRQRLAEVGEIMSGITLGRKLNGVETRKVPYLRVANVKDGYLDLSDLYEIDATKADIEKCTLKYGDLLLTEGGDPDKLGRGTFWEEQIPECLHQNHIFRVRFDLDKFFPRFVSYQVSSAYGKSYFLAHAKQTTGIATINQKVLGNFPLLIPSSEEQKQIAEKLKSKIADAKNLVASLESQLAELNSLPASLLRKAFEGGG
jgi:type I restriction enzyme S subunit